LEDTVVAVAEQLNRKEYDHYLQEEMAKSLTFLELVNYRGKIVEK
jgi:hypothetical protein